MDSSELNSIVNEDLYCSSTQEIDNASNVIKHVVQELPNSEDFEDKSYNEGQECDSDDDHDEYLPPSGILNTIRKTMKILLQARNFKAPSDDCPQSEDFDGTNYDFDENSCTNNGDGFIHNDNSNGMNDDFNSSKDFNGTDDNSPPSYNGFNETNDDFPPRGDFVGTDDYFLPSDDFNGTIR